MQRHRLFWRFAFALGGGYNHQHFFLANLFELVITGIHQVYVQLCGQQVITQLLSQTTCVAGLGSGKQRNGGRFGRSRSRCSAGDGATRGLFHPAPEIA